MWMDSKVDTYIGDETEEEYGLNYNPIHRPYNI